MAITDDISSRASNAENSVVDAVRESAKYILEDDYQKAYDKLSENTGKTVADVSNNNYRDERVIANTIQQTLDYTEIAEDLSAVATGESTPSESSLEPHKRRLRNFAKNYLEEDSV